MTLGKHSLAVAEALKGDATLYYAGLLHDIGKPYTKSFINSKGETSKNANYYQHHCVGAYESLFYKYPLGVVKLNVSILINLHMYPYFWEKDEKYGGKDKGEI
jgi:putative nucleotidyltransferase with HDIG domain